MRGNSTSTQMAGTLIVIILHDTAYERLNKRQESLG